MQFHLLLIVAYLKDLCVFLLQLGAIEVLLGRRRVGEEVADLAHALVAAATKAQPTDRFALERATAIRINSNQFKMWPNILNSMTEDHERQLGAL
jgi:hypothetical protein